MKRIVLLSLAIMSCLVLCSCESIENILNVNIRKHEPKFTVSIHNYIKYPRGLDIEKTLYTIDGKKVVINRNPLISSAMIIDAVALQREDDPHSYDISLKLNQTALKVWLQLAFDNYSQHVLLIDDAYYSMFIPDSGHDEDTEWVTLRGPFNEVFANGIEKFAKRNYRELNPSPSGF
jgi:hypothetical protein